MTTPPRRPPTKDEIVAACILDITRDGKPIVSRDEAKHLTAKEVFEVFRDRIAVDHIVPRAIGGEDHHSNYQPLLREAEHKPKTKKDIAAIAKTKRIAKQQQEFRSRLLAKSGLAEDVGIMQTSRSKRPSRALPGTKASGLKKKMNGKVERRQDNGRDLRTRRHFD